MLSSRAWVPTLSLILFWGCTSTSSTSSKDGQSEAKVDALTVQGGVGGGPAQGGNRAGGTANQTGGAQTASGGQSGNSAVILDARASLDAIPVGDRPTDFGTSAFADAQGGSPDGPWDRGRDTRPNVLPDAAASLDAANANSQRPFKGVANSLCSEMQLFKSTWYYNWKLGPEEPNCRDGGEFVPMIWGHVGNERSATGITNLVSGLVRSGYSYVLGFNEPDKADQSNIPVATALELWPSFNNPAIKIGSPSTQANTTGLAWFREFMSRVNADTTGSLRVDFLAVHWYGWNAGSCEPTASTLENYLKQIEAIPGNRPIWITEWGCMNQSNPNMATVEAFLKGAVAMFARHPRIERYAWYPWNPYNELASNRTSRPPILSSLGTLFASLPGYR